MPWLMILQFATIYITYSVSAKYTNIDFTTRINIHKEKAEKVFEKDKPRNNFTIIYIVIIIILGILFSQVKK